MAVHNDGTMDVNVGDRIERRECVMHVSYGSRGIGNYEPILRDGERLMLSYTDIPTIIKLHE